MRVSKFEGIKRRLEQLATAGGGGNAVITIRVVVDATGTPRYLTTSRVPLEPKRAPLDHLIGLLGDDANEL